MTALQYKNTIKWTKKQLPKDEEPTNIVAEIFKNCGVGFPRGNCKDIRITLAKNNYMSWEECTAAEAQNAANRGISAVGVGDGRAVVIMPDGTGSDEEINYGSDDSVSTVSDISEDEKMNMSFFTYTATMRKEPSTLDRLKTMFPHGKYWNRVGKSSNNADGYTDTPCPSHDTTATCNEFNGAKQCMGFAYKCGYEATGKYCINEWTRYASVSAVDNIKPGDVVHYYTASGSPHSIYVTGVNGETVTYGECNGAGSNHYCKIEWNQTVSKSTLRNGFRAIRSAPVTLDV